MRNWLADTEKPNFSSRIWIEQFERESAARRKLWEGEALLIIFSVGLCEPIAEHDRMRPCDYCKMCYVLRDRTTTKCDVFSSSESVAKCSKVHLVTALRISNLRIHWLLLSLDRYRAHVPHLTRLIFTEPDRVSIHSAELQWVLQLIAAGSWWADWWDILHGNMFRQDHITLHTEQMSNLKLNHANKDFLLAYFHRLPENLSRL